MGTWTTHVRIPVDRWRESPDVDRLIVDTERRVRAALRGAATDPEAEVALWWSAIIPGVDPSAHEDTPRGTVSITWKPGEKIPDGADEITCRGRAVT
jgi:alpha-beta hydrolase superfamily lysophospholipase